MVNEIIAGYELTLRNFKIVTGHDDSLPFNASLYINGQRVCKCFNDGWGGVADCTDFTDKGKALFDAVCAALFGMTFPLTPYPGNTVYISKSIGDICDDLACRMADEIQTQRVVKKHQNKALVFDCDDRIYWIPLKNSKGADVYISQAASTVKGRELIKAIVERELAKGAKFLNTNVDYKSY